MSCYLNEFRNNEDIIERYEAPKDALDGAIVHIAWYGYGDYCGSSLVIFEKDGKLYEVNGSHCSCYGLEGQWAPELTSWEALDMRILSYSCDGSSDAAVKLKELCALKKAPKVIFSPTTRLFRENSGSVN